MDYTIHKKITSYERSTWIKSNFHFPAEEIKSGKVFYH